LKKGHLCCFELQGIREKKRAGKRKVRTSNRLRLTQFVQGRGISFFLGVDLGEKHAARSVKKFERQRHHRGVEVYTSPLLNGRKKVSAKGVEKEGYWGETVTIDV